MYLEIPIKLESYVTEIKRQTRFVKNANKITLLQMGSAQVSDKIKVLLLIYNPFPVSLKVNCDFFTKESNVCKMYPGEFNIDPQSAYAFVAYLSHGKEVAIDEAKIIANLKRNLSNRILKLNAKYEPTGYEPHNIYKIEASDFEVDQTINLDSHMQKIKKQKVVEYNQSHYSLVDVFLQKVEIKDDVVRIGVKFSNNAMDLDLQIKGYRLKIFDDSKIIHVEVKQEMILKHQSYKIAYVQLNKIEFSQVERKNMQFKIVIV